MLSLSFFTILPFYYCDQVCVTVSLKQHRSCVCVFMLNVIMGEAEAAVRYIVLISARSHVILLQ